MPLLQISSDDLLGLAITLARRWGALTLPAEHLVRVSNFEFRRGVPIGQPGLITLEPAPGAPAGQLALQGCSFDLAAGGADETLGTFIDWLQGEIDARA